MSVGRVVAAGIAALGAGGAAALAYAAVRDQTADSDETGEELAVTAAPVAPAGSRTLGAKAAEVLARYLGVHGQGAKGSAGYHRASEIDAMLRGFYNDAGDKLLGKAWCARAVRFAFEKAASELGIPKPFPARLGTMAMAESWKKSPFAGYLLDTAKVGAAWVIKTSAGFHTGLVAKVNGPLSVVTIEGNHGDAIANVKRTFDLTKDALVDVEAWIADQSKPEALVGLGLFGAESA